MPVPDPYSIPTADPYSLVHVEYGPIRTLTTRGQAERELLAVLENERTWAGDPYVEPFRLVVDKSRIDQS